MATIGPPLILTVDIQNRILVARNGSPTQLPAMFQDNTQSLQIFCVNPAPNNLPTGSSSAANYVVQNMLGFGMRAAIGPTPEGIAGPAILALQTLTWDVPSQSFLGDLALNTTAIDDFLGEAPEATAYFELNLTGSGSRFTVLQTTFLLKAVVDELNGTVPNPNQTFLSTDEIKAQYVPRKMAPGDTILIPSPSGVYALELGCNDDGTIKSNIVNQT